MPFDEAFHAWWRELAWCALKQPDLFAFTFLHWHPRAHTPDTHPPFWPSYPGAIIRSHSYGGATRALVREVLELGEREGAFAPGCGRVGEGLVWGTLMELARSAMHEGAHVGEAEILASAQALWRALMRPRDSGPRCTGTPPPSEETPSAGAVGGLAAAETVAAAPDTGALPEMTTATETSSRRERVADEVPHTRVDAPLTTGCRARSGTSRNVHAGPRVGRACAGAASLTGRPRGRTAGRRSTRDALQAHRPHPRATSGAHQPVHPVERAECPATARRNPRRDALPMPSPTRGSGQGQPGSRSCGPGRGWPCSRWCCRRELQRSPSTGERVDSWLELKPMRGWIRSRAFLLPRIRAPPLAPSSRARDCPVPCATSPPPRW